MLASTFYPALKKENVELVPKAVSFVTRTGIVDADGVERAVDVIVMATGFQPSNYLGRLPMTGRDGGTLQEYWAGEPHAYLGITVPGFPNFFMLYGPGTNGGEIVSMLESQAAYTVRAVKRMMRERVTAVEVRRRFEAVWSYPLAGRLTDASLIIEPKLGLFAGPNGGNPAKIPNEDSQGFEFDGVVYQSLSAVAKAITGTHTNGFLFFRLVGKGDSP